MLKFYKLISEMSRPNSALLRFWHPAPIKIICGNTLVMCLSLFHYGRGRLFFHELLSFWQARSEWNALVNDWRISNRLSRGVNVFGLLILTDHGLIEFHGLLHLD